MRAGKAMPPTPFTPFAEVVEEYQRYQQSDAWQRQSLLGGAKTLTTRTGFLSPVPLPGRAATTDILRLKISLDSAAFRRLTQAASACQPPTWP
jgi:enterobactin synthetase component F